MSRPPVEQTLRTALARLDPSAATGPTAPDEVGDLAAALLDAAASHRSGLDHDGVQATRFRSALDRVSEGVVVCDEDGTEVYCNSAARRHMTARVAGSLTTTAVQEHLAAARRDGRSEHLLELFLPVPRILSIRAFSLGGGNGPLGSVAVIEDVSERRRVDAIRRDFVANVSHELKTPVGALSLLAETLDGEDDPDVVARLASRITTEAERLCRLIDDLLDLSRIEANEAPVWGAVPVRTVMGQSIETVRPLAEAGGITLELVEPDPDLEVVGDGWELVSALTNLIDNAVKYSEPGGRVTVSAAGVTNAAPSGRGVELTVNDRGIGIPKRDLERIFERFYRVDRARSRATGGTGLGLSIVRHVAANHAGTVRVVSEEGVGSSFTLSLPIADEAAPVISHASAEGADA